MTAEEETMSHQSRPIAHGKHWNDAPPLAQIRRESRSATPLLARSQSNSPSPGISQARLDSTIDIVLSAPSKLTSGAHSQLCTKIRSTMHQSASLSDETRAAIAGALLREDETLRSPDVMRRNMVEFIRLHAADSPGIIKWASALRSVAENVKTVATHGDQADIEG